MSKTANHGFSLVELLIALGILGILAMFTIPKVFQTNSNNSSKQTALARDAAHLIMAAYGQYKLTNSPVATTTKATDLTPYMNYVSLDTVSSIDGMFNEADITCATTRICLSLHNGGKLLLYNSGFNGSSTTNAVMLQFDPDGTANESTTNGPGSSLKMVLYYDGTVKSRGTIFSDTVSGSVTYQPGSSYDPVWFTGF
jgi:prepilin-type N-terminal cleavage/methylation domain-containing protein